MDNNNLFLEAYDENSWREISDFKYLQKSIVFGLIVLNKFFFLKLPEIFGWEFRWMESFHIL